SPTPTTSPGGTTRTTTRRPKRTPSQPPSSNLTISRTGAPGDPRARATRGLWLISPHGRTWRVRAPASPAHPAVGGRQEGARRQARDDRRKGGGAPLRAQYVQCLRRL